MRSFLLTCDGRCLVVAVDEKVLDADVGENVGVEEIGGVGEGAPGIARSVLENLEDVDDGEVEAEADLKSSTEVKSNESDTSTVIPPGVVEDPVE